MREISFRVHSPRTSSNHLPEHRQSMNDQQGSTSTATVDRVVLDPAANATPSAALVHVVDATPIQHAQTGTVTPTRVVEGMTFTPDQVQLIKATIAKNATDDELDLFLYTCRRLRLDPFARQIYFMKRNSSGDEDSNSNDAGRAQVSIDGFRLVAERTGEYQGQTPPEWARVTHTDHGPVIDWFPVWPFDTSPHSARIGVYRKGFREPMYAVARFEAYKVTKRTGALNRMWSKMGPEQLAKCAEALALRKAFPQELSGVYTPGGMGQAENDDDESSTPRRAPSRAPARQGARTDASTSNAAKRDAERESQRATPRRSPDRAPVLFPYNPRRGVALDAKFPAGHEHAGQYQVDDTLLTRALARLTNALDTGEIDKKEGDATVRVKLTDEERDRMTRLFDAIALEQEERSDERGDLADKPVPASLQQAAPTADAAENDAAENDAARRSIDETRTSAPLNDTGDDLPG
jgi:phage recombination protein Bet